MTHVVVRSKSATTCIRARPASRRRRQTVVSGPNRTVVDRPPLRSSARRTKMTICEAKVSFIQTRSLLPSQLKPTNDIGLVDRLQKLVNVLVDARLDLVSSPPPASQKSRTSVPLVPDRASRESSSSDGDIAERLFHLTISSFSTTTSKTENVTPRIRLIHEVSSNSASPDREQGVELKQLSRRNRLNSYSSRCRNSRIRSPRARRLFHFSVNRPLPLERSWHDCLLPTRLS